MGSLNKVTYMKRYIQERYKDMSIQSMGAYNTFYKFKLPNPPDDKLSDLKSVFLQIKTDYVWGMGWTDMDKAKEYEDVFYSMLLAQDDWVLKPSSISGGCPSLMSKDGMKLYMHPMEITGYCTQAQLDKILEIIGTIEKNPNLYGEVIKSHHLAYVRPTYELTDSEYIQFLEENKDSIIDYIKNIPTPLSPVDIGRDFASNCRIARPYDSTIGVFNSLDADVKYITELAKIVDRERTRKDMVDDLLNNKSDEEIADLLDR